MTEDDLIHRQQGRDAFMLIGGYIMVWGQLETKLSWSFHELAPDAARPDIDPGNISRTLTHLLKEWEKALKAYSPFGHSAGKNLCQEIRDAAPGRNALCHGFNGVVTHLNDPEFALCCWNKYHETKMRGSFPKQQWFHRSELEEMTAHVERLTRWVSDITHDVQLTRERAQAPEA